MSVALNNGAGRPHNEELGSLQAPVDQSADFARHHAAEQVLKKIAAREVPPIILVAGRAEDFARVSNVIKSGDSAALYDTIRASSGEIVARRNEVVFADREGVDTYVGLLSSDILRVLSHRELIAKLVFVGDERNIPLATEAVKSLIPHCPVGALVVRGPLGNGSSTSLLEGFVDTALVEMPLSTDRICGAVQSVVDSAKARSAIGALEALQPVRILNSGDPIPAGVYASLEETVIPHAKACNLDILLRGGCGIVTFMPKARPISPDIDFTALLPVSQFRRFVDFMNSVGPEQPFEVRGDPEAAVTTRSTYVKGKISVADPRSESHESVSLDAVAVRRVFDIFAYEFKYDKIVNRYHHVAKLDSGAEIGVVAPELTLVEKLVAGRGKEVDKYDILDATGILANQSLELVLVQRIIERQRYDAAIDSDLALNPIRYATADQQLRDLGIATDPKLRLLLLEALDEQREAQRDTTSWVGCVFEPNRLKKIGLVNKLLIALDKVVLAQGVVDDRLCPPASAEELWSAPKIQAGVESLRAFLYNYARWQLLRRDVYVERNSQSLHRSTASGFWSQRIEPTGVFEPS